MKRFVSLLLLTGCTPGMYPPSYNDTQQFVDTGIRVNEKGVTTLSNQHKAMVPEIAEKLQAIRDTSRSEVEAIRKEMREREGDIGVLVRDTINPIAQQVLGIDLLTERMQKDVATLPDIVETVKDVARDSDTLSDKLVAAVEDFENLEVVVGTLSNQVITRITELDATTVARLQESITNSGTFKAVLKDAVGIDELKLAELENAAKKAGMSLQELVMAMVASGGGAIAIARKMGSGGKVAELKQEIEDMKTENAKA